MLLGVEVRKHHLNRVATWHCDMPVTVLVVWVILRVLWARKSTRVLPTDGRWATCGQSICASVRGGTNRPNYTEQDWPVASELVPGGMYFPFCLQRARYDNPIRQKVPRENQWNTTSSSGFFRNNRVAIK